MSEPGAAPERRVSVGELIGLPLVLAFLLFVIQAHRHDVWGIVWSVVFLAVVLALGGGALWELVAGRRKPGSDALVRAYAAAALVGVGLLPLAGWVLVVIAARPWGIVLPLLFPVAFAALARVGAAGSARPRD